MELELSEDDVKGLYLILLKADILIRYELKDQYPQFEPIINRIAEEIENKLELGELAKQWIP